MGLLWLSLGFLGRMFELGDLVDSESEGPWYFIVGAMYFCLASWLVFVPVSPALLTLDNEGVRRLTTRGMAVFRWSDVTEVGRSIGRQSRLVPHPGAQPAANLRLHRKIPTCFDESMTLQRVGGSGLTVFEQSGKCF